MFFRKKHKYTCVCCGYRSLTEEKSYQICPICFWEDDGDYKNGVDPGLTLYEAQQNFLNIGACEAAMKPHTRPPLSHEEQDPRWKPLEQELTEDNDDIEPYYGHLRS